MRRHLAFNLLLSGWQRLIGIRLCLVLFHMRCHIRCHIPILFIVRVVPQQLKRIHFEVRIHFGVWRRCRDLRFGVRSCRRGGRRASGSLLGTIIAGVLCRAMKAPSDHLVGKNIESHVYASIHVGQHPHVGLYYLQQRRKQRVRAGYTQLKCPLQEHMNAPTGAKLWRV